MAAAQIISGYKTVAFVPNFPVWRVETAAGRWAEPQQREIKEKGE